MAFLRLDPIGLKILDAIQRDGRITKLTLADKVGLLPTPCWMRLRKLENAGIIRAITPVSPCVRWPATARPIRPLRTRHPRHPRDRHLLVGGVDYVLKVMARDIDVYQRLVDSLLAREIGIDRYFRSAQPNNWWGLIRQNLATR